MSQTSIPWTWTLKTETGPESGPSGILRVNVSVYLMEITTKKMERSISNETISSSIDEKSCNLLDSVERKDTSLFD